MERRWQPAALYYSSTTTSMIDDDDADVFCCLRAQKEEKKSDALLQPHTQKYLFLLTYYVGSKHHPSGCRSKSRDANEEESAGRFEW